MTALATIDADLAANPGHWTVAHGLEVKLCQRNFLHWCERWVRIEDKETHRAIPFNPYRCQRDLARRLIKRMWLRILKARRLGVTWLLAAFAVWLVTLHEMRTVGYLVHKREFALDFLKRCRFIRNRLPWFLQSTLTQDTREILEFDHDGQGCWIRAFAATPGAADSVAADLVLIDEAPKIEKLNPGLLKEILRSVEPTVETARGFVILCGTSEGPQGAFHDGWQAAKQHEDLFHNIFWSWRERPGRNRKWYDREAKLHRSDPLYMPRQYPDTAEEAFAHAQGRIYPRFSEATHVGRFDAQDRLIWKRDDSVDMPKTVIVNDAWPKWRGIDWGGVDPFAVLWVTQVPGDRTALTVDPRCTNLIRELISYRRKPDSEYIVDKDNHAVDCLRYIIVTFDLQGHVHVYNELYIPRTAEKGLAIPNLADEIRAMSGDEEYRGTVADRSRTDNILLMKRHLRCRVRPHTKPSAASDKTRQEVEQGIQRLNILIVGTHDMFPARARDPLEVAYEDLRQHPCPPSVGMSIRDHRRSRKIIGDVRSRIARFRGPARRRPSRRLRMA